MPARRPKTHPRPKGCSVARHVQSSATLLTAAAPQDGTPPPLRSIAAALAAGRHGPCGTAHGIIISAAAPAAAALQPPATACFPTPDRRLVRSAATSSSSGAAAARSPTRAALRASSPAGRWRLVGHGAPRGAARGAGALPSRVQPVAPADAGGARGCVCRRPRPHRCRKAAMQCCSAVLQCSACGWLRGTCQ